MGSSGGGGGGGGMAALMGQGTPMPNLPVAGSAGTVNPQEYGKFQSFLPDIKAEGINDMATGLRPHMFQYKSPSGVVAEGSGGGAGGGDTAGLRDMLAQLLAGGGGGGGGSTWMPNSASSGSPTDGPSVSDIRGGSWQPTGGGGGGVGTMGMGGGGYGGGGGWGGIQGPPGPPGSNPVAYSAAPINYGVPGWGPRPGISSPRAAAGVNSDPAAAAAAAAAAKASGG
jgi:hypothetical protein